MIFQEKHQLLKCGGVIYDSKCTAFGFLDCWKDEWSNLKTSLKSLGNSNKHF